MQIYEKSETFVCYIASNIDPAGTVTLQGLLSSYTTSLRPKNYQMEPHILIFSLKNVMYISRIEENHIHIVSFTSTLSKYDPYIIIIGNAHLNKSVFDGNIIRLMTSSRATYYEIPRQQW